MLNRFFMANSGKLKREQMGTVSPTWADTIPLPRLRPVQDSGIRSGIRWPLEDSERSVTATRYDWRRGSESNRRIRLLQSPALPLGYPAVRLRCEKKSVYSASKFLLSTEFQPSPPS